MINTPQIRQLKPGQMMKASEWNAVVRKSQSTQPSKAGYDGIAGTAYRKQITPYRKPVSLHTEIAIPAYSVFPVKKYTGGIADFESVQFDPDEIDDYIDGYIGTNGNTAVPAGQNFTGYFLDEYHDDLVRIYSNGEVGKECGLSERAGLSADTDTLGMIITKTFSGNTFYVRKMNRMPDFFATLDEDFTVADDEYTSVTLEDPETFAGEQTIEEVYPAWNIPVDTEIEEGARVIVRFDSKRNKWFFFRPAGESGKIVTVYGDVLKPRSGADTVFYSEMAAGETVANSSYPLSITAVPKIQDSTGSYTNLYSWVKFPTSFTTLDETPIWWKRNPENPLYPYLYQFSESSGSYKIVPVDYYGKVIKNSSSYYFPRYRFINNHRYWKKDSIPVSYIYFTFKGNDSGWCVGSTLGKFLTSTDTEPFVQIGTGSEQEALEALLTSQGMAFNRPEWNSSTEFGVYQPNSLATGTIQFGCGRWTASDGRSLATPFRFTHVGKGNVEKWLGSYTCEAFNSTFKNIKYGNPYSATVKYYIGEYNGKNGCYYSDNAPSTSGQVTFNYRAGIQGGLRASLSYIRTSGSTEEWRLHSSSNDEATYQRQVGGETLTGGFRQLFGNITKSENVWTVNGNNQTIGNLTFTGNLSQDEPNIFTFSHSITLTFDQYVQGSEKSKVYICSPGVFS